MVHFFDITKFNLYKEDNRREVKSKWRPSFFFMGDLLCFCKLLWRRNYSGSCRKQRWNLENYRFKSTDRDKLLKHFWDTINNRKKVNVNLLSDQDVRDI